MRAGDIVFVRGHSIISRLVKWIDKGGEFSHVSVAVSESHIIEAEYSTRVTIRPFQYEDYEILDLGLSDLERVWIATLAKEEVGKWYDYGQVLWIILRRFFRMEGENRFNSPNNFICSELVNYLLYEIHKIPPGTNLTDCTPNQLYAYLNAQFPVRIVGKGHDTIVQNER